MDAPKSAGLKTDEGVPPVKEDFENYIEKYRKIEAEYFTYEEYANYFGYDYRSYFEMNNLEKFHEF